MKKILTILLWFGLSYTLVNASSMMCIEVYNPVCGVKSWIVKTYSNDCFAKVDWAKILHAWVCTGLEKYNLIKQLKYIKWKTKIIIDKAIDRFFKKLSSKTIPEQLNILQEKIKKIDKVSLKLEKSWKLTDFLWEVLFYIKFKFEEKISELKSTLTWGRNDISPDLLKSILEETK